MSETKVINKSTNPVRLSYAAIFEPKQDLNGNLKYSTAILIPKSDTALVEEYKRAEAVAIEEGIKSKWGGKKPPKLKTPIRDGDEERPDDPVYAGHYFVNASSNNAPGVLDEKGVALTKENGGESKVYSGCYARVSVNFFPFDAQGSKGVAVGLNNIKKISDGDKLAGRASAESDFGDEGDFGPDAI